MTGIAARRSATKTPISTTNDSPPTIRYKKNCIGSAVPNLKLGLAVGELVAIVAAREHALQPAIENDEQIARAHLLDPQFGNALLAVLPGVGQHRIAVAADDAFERQLDRQVEVVR